jgi:hypothetical protein
MHSSRYIFILLSFIYLFPNVDLIPSNIIIIYHISNDWFNIDSIDLSNVVRPIVGIINVIILHIKYNYYYD